MRIIYWLISLIYQQVAHIHLRNRVAKGKESPIRYKEKLGVASIHRPDVQLIWIHAASVGELNSVIPIIKEMPKTNPEIKFLVTTVTLTSANIFANANLRNAVHQFCPIDCPRFVTRFLKHWRPDLAIFVDSELWPNLLEATHKCCKLLMFNGRLSDKSFSRWMYIKSFLSYLYSLFDRIYPTSPNDAKKIGHFVPWDKLTFIGNLKYIPKPFNFNEDELFYLRKITHGRKCWLAASTHPGEFLKIMKVHKNLKKRFPDILTMVCPRHQRNCGLIAKNARAYGLSLSLHSFSHQKIDSDIYLFDTVDNLLLLYKFADIVFVGGSLIPHGGQNMFEPAGFDCAILTGSNVSNFTNTVEDMLEAKALILVNSAKELEARLEILFAHDKIRAEFARNAKLFSNRGQNILPATIQEISNAISRV